MNIRLKFEILTFSAAPETHFESIPMLGGGLTQHLWVRPLWFSTLQLLCQFKDHWRILRCTWAAVNNHWTGLTFFCTKGKQQMNMVPVLLQEKAACMCPTCVKVLAWTVMYPSLLGGEKLWVQGYKSIDSRVVRHRFTLVPEDQRSQLQDTAAVFRVAPYIYIHLKCSIYMTVVLTCSEYDHSTKLSTQASPAYVLPCQATR